MQIFFGALWLLSTWTYVFVNVRREWRLLSDAAKKILIHSYPEDLLYRFPLFLTGLSAILCGSGYVVALTPGRAVVLLIFPTLYFFGFLYEQRRLRKEATRIPASFLLRVRNLSLVWFAGLIGFTAAVVLHSVAA